MLATVGLVAFWYSATLLFNYTFFKLTRIKNDEAVKMVAQDITVIEMFTCTVLGVLTLYSKELPFVPVPAVRVRVLVVAVANAASCQAFAMAMDYINLSLVQTIRACQPICACESQRSIHTCDRSALSPVKHRHGVREGMVVRGNLTTLLRGCCTQSPSCWCTRSGVVRVVALPAVLIFGCVAFGVQPQRRAPGCPLAARARLMSRRRASAPTRPAAPAQPLLRQRHHATTIIEAPCLVKGGHSASLRHHTDRGVMAQRPTPPRPTPRSCPSAWVLGWRRAATQSTDS
jgi:hypothetical protein